jgi:DNA helicase-2/ATP-dependent DNA helicase PcrA
MPVMFSITDEQIAKAEEILLPDGCHFDEERRIFIKDFRTLDLQAVPGSGKTTALLAKLIVLEDFFPLKSGAGVLVLSHTNAAIEEIKERLIKHCPKLFSYPNFVGTIQGFVDTFLCAPAYMDRYKKKIFRIDDVIYENYHDPNHLNYQSRSYLERNKNKADKIFFKSRLFGNDDLKFLDEKDKFPLKSKTKPTYKGFLKIKKLLRERGVLCFEDAYILANEHIDKYPKIIQVLKNRFNFVFVDEMQDMETHQYDILERVFFEERDNEFVYQRIGDKNQAIFNSENDLENIWQNREVLLNINGSHRLTPQVAELVNCFTVNNEEGFQIKGLRNGEIKPIILVYNDENIELVIEKFSEIVKNSSINIEENITVKSIGWIKDKIADYYPEFSPEAFLLTTDCSCLESYIVNCNLEQKNFREIRKAILNALIKVIRLERIRNVDESFFTKKKLLRYLKEDFQEFHKELNVKLFSWAFDVAKSKGEAAFTSIQAFIPSLLSIFNKTINESKAFIEDRAVVEKNADGDTITSNNNKVNFHGFDIDIATVHSAKGQTHTATLYLETSFKRGTEPKRLANQFKFNSLNGEEKNIVKNSSKMCYVGMSRPTDLLCVAVHEKILEKHLNDLDREKWDIVFITEIG